MTENSLSDNDRNSEALPISERPKTNLEVVREQLLADPNLFCAGELFRHPITGYFAETVDVIVAPIKPIFDPEKLNEFMDTLIAGVKTSARDAAYLQDDGGIHLGKLYYDEPIGTKKQIITTHVAAIDPDALNRAGMTIGETQEAMDSQILRRTWVSVYPEPISASSLYKYESGLKNGTLEPSRDFEYIKHWLTGDQVRKLRTEYSRGTFSRIAGLLKK